MAGEHGSGVFDTGAAFDGGLEEVAELGGDVEDGREEKGLPDGFGDVEDEVAAGGESDADPDDDGGGDDAAYDGGDGAFPGLAGA